MKRLQQRLDDLPDRLRLPLPPEHLSRLDAELGDAFPPALRSWLATVGPFDFLNLEEMGVVRESVPDWASLSGEWIDRATRLLDRRSWLCEQTGIPDAVPVADDGAGNTFFLRREGDDATIWFHDHERQQVVQVADSFIAWAHAKLDRDVSDESAAHEFLCTWRLKEDVGSVDVLEQAVRSLLGNDAKSKRHSYPTFVEVDFPLGKNEISVRRQTFPDGDVFNTVFIAYQTTPEGRELFEKLERLVQENWEIAAVERSIN